LLPCSAGAQLKDKALRKECKAKCKELRAQGWTVYNQEVTLDDAVTAFYQKIEVQGDSTMQVVGTGEHRDAHTAQRKAYMQAARQLAGMKGTRVSGRMKTDMRNEAAGDSVTSVTTHDSSFESSTQQTVKSLEPALTLSRPLSNGNTEVQMFFLVGK
jgi:hypothetical protein